MDAVRAVITHPQVIGVWLTTMLASRVVLVRDLRVSNPGIRGLMAFHLRLRAHDGTAGPGRRATGAGAA